MLLNLQALPNSVLKRSEEILQLLEKNHHNPMETGTAIIKAVKDNQNTQLCFLDDIVIDAEIPAHLKHLEDEISKLDVMKMTPIDALLKLNDLKKHLELQ